MLVKQSSPDPRSVSVHGTRIAYRQEGPDDGPLILLIHGVASQSATWEPALGILAGRSHRPHQHNPERFAAAPADFVATTAPSAGLAGRSWPGSVRHLTSGNI